MATIVDDVQASTSATTSKIKGFPLKVKSFQNSATYQKLQGGVPSTPLLYHGGGMNLRVSPRVKPYLGEPCKEIQTTNVLRMLNILIGLFYTGSRKVHCSSL